MTGSEMGKFTHFVPGKKWVKPGERYCVTKEKTPRNIPGV
jgi:hypothetical protein